MTEELEKEATEYAQKLGAKDFIAKPKEIVAYFAYLAGAEPREKQIQALGERCLQLQKDKGNLTDRVRELEAQIEKLIDFVLSKTECCDVCPITDTCINSEGTCPYAGILAKGEEAVTREWLLQFISRR